MTICNPVGCIFQDVLPADKENVNPNVPETKARRSRKGSKDTLKYGSMRTQRGLKVPITIMAIVFRSLFAYV